jgi:uncharacterized membrane protein
MYAAIITLAACSIAFVFFASLSKRPAPVPIQPRSPLSEAERILAMKYARGDLSPEAYERTLAVLRRR